MKKILPASISLVATIIFVLLIIMLASIFHYPIRIVDAITSETAAGFDVHVSLWRILFEPVIGPLLFYLRADQPLVEFLVLMVWVMAIILASSLLPCLKNKSVAKLTAIRTGILRWLAKLPIILNTWVALLLILIFAPLPSNVIINHQNDTILVNVHSHSHYSHDGLASHQRLMAWHQRNGFDAFFITDHNHHQKTLAAVQAQKSKKLPAQPLLLAGQEYSGSNHLLLLGLKRDFRTKDMPDTTAIDSAHGNDGAAFVAHWFADKHRTIQYYIDCGVDGFEIANQGEGIHYDRKIFQDIMANCKANGLLMLGACDWHGYGSTCFVWNALNIPGWQQMDDDQKRASIINILRQRNQARLKVLLYRDRHIFNRNQAWLSPVYTFIGYFRTLNFYQVFSWITWIVLFHLLKRVPLMAKINEWLRLYPLRRWALSGLTGAVFVTVIGAVLLIKAQSLPGYNEIFSEYGTYFLGFGSGCIVYSAILTFKKQGENKCA